MEDFIISVGKVEEWQMTNDIAALDLVFDRAKRVLVGGGVVALVRSSGRERFTGLRSLDRWRILRNIGRACTGG
ncbi:MAG TPA: hypothetical protein VMH27_11460 [Puia sp.]|nr:hypothetical protein [Puia sp.]